MICLHILGATIWVGGHLVVMFSILPETLKNEDASILLGFEKRYEKLGMPSLFLQIITGLWLAYHLLGMPANWFGTTPIAHVIQIKLTLLFLTACLAIHAKTRVIPKLTNDSLSQLAWHIRAVSICAILFVLAGASIRFGGYPIFKG